MAIAMPGGAYPMGRSETAGASDYYPDGNQNETPEHSATISGFALDKYEVTVGRFREFVNNYDAWRSSRPSTGDGTNTNAPGTGWGQSWVKTAGDLPVTAADLKNTLLCDSANQTWTGTLGNSTTEDFPVNCVTWYEAFAFCIWDGGRLPTEAEWEYAAAGGSQNRLFPWGNSAPSGQTANYSGSDDSPKIVVGAKQSTGGTGYFGHADLAGSMWEWVFDWFQGDFYGTTGSPVECLDCANVSAAAGRTVRGGGWFGGAAYLRAAERSYYDPSNGIYDIGFRCARKLP